MTLRVAPGQPRPKPACMRDVFVWAALCCLISSTADDAVNVSRVAAWALQRREERIRRWLPSAPFNRTGFRLVPVAPKLERGFLLVATRVETTTT